MVKACLFSQEISTKDQAIFHLNFPVNNLLLYVILEISHDKDYISTVIATRMMARNLLGRVREDFAKFSRCSLAIFTKLQVAILRLQMV